MVEKSGRRCLGCRRVTPLVSAGRCRECQGEPPKVKRPRRCKLEPAGLPPSGVSLWRRNPREERQYHALVRLPLPEPPPPGHGALEEEERAHRVAVFCLQVEEMAAEGVRRPLDYTDPRLYWEPAHVPDPADSSEDHND